MTTALLAWFDRVPTATWLHYGRWTAGAVVVVALAVTIADTRRFRWLDSEELQ